MKHSTLPWRNEPYTGRIFDRDEALIARTTVAAHPKDALFIIRACNSVEILVSAVSEAEKLLREIRDIMPDWSMRDLKLRIDALLDASAASNLNTQAANTAEFNPEK